jgi:hypothetical protein
MRVLTIRRLVDTPSGEALGQIEREDRSIICKTLEKAWVDKNADGISDKSVSRIPAGKFLGRRRFSPSHERELFELVNVPGRANIQFHSGNTTDDSLGCIITGLKYGTLRGKPAVLDGRLGEAALMKELAAEDEVWFVFEDAFAVAA